MSSSKENDGYSTPTNKRLAMNNDVFTSPIPVEMMLSPPPEEELRYTRRPTQEPSSASKPFTSSHRSNQPSPAVSQTSKRKRTITGASIQDSPIASPNQLESSIQIQRTPNPRVRKQVRYAGVSASPAVASRSDAHGSSPPSRGSSSRPYAQEDPMMTPTRKGKSLGRSTELVPQSPYASNPSADYIPPAHLTASPRGVSVRRRSVTPIPPYEPPKERYTPPREIIVSPHAAAERKPARRVAPKKKRVNVKSDKPMSQLRVKTEPPEIDLTKPAPPASPSEDPILLVGPPTLRIQRPSASPSKSRDPASLVDFEMELNILESERRAAEHVTQTVRSSSSIPPAFDFNFNDDDAGAANNGWTDSSSDVDYGNIIEKGTIASGPGFDDAGFSDSDDDDGNGVNDASVGQGDFTGTFLAYKAPVKLDPPIGEERDRMEEWARPISPHPKKLSFTEPKEEDVEEGLSLEGTPTVGQKVCKPGPGGADQSATSGEEDANENENANDETQRTPGYQDKRGRRLTLSEVEAIRFGSKHSTPKASSADKLKGGKALQDGEPRTEDAKSVERVEDSFEQDDHYTNYEDSMHMDNNQLDTSLDNSTRFDNGPEQTFDISHNLDGSYGLDKSTTEKGNINIFTARSASERSSGESSQSTLNNAELTGTKYYDRVGVDEEAQRRLHHGESALQEDTMKRSASLLRAQTPPNAELSGVETELEESEDNSDEGAGDVSVIKIMSDDPMAAARAAAILKMHDYDMVARKLRRRKTATGGISKGYTTPKKTQLWRRRTVAGLSAEDDLAGNVTLPELLVKAEEDLRNSPVRSHSRSGSMALSSAGTPQRDRYQDFMYENAEAEGIREWTKADWKMLDSCFTDERYDLGEHLGLEAGCLADVDDVPLEVVVERFVEIMGGAEKVEGHGPSWTPEKLISRVKALCKRQRSGQGAPPTPDVSMRFSTPPRFASPSMIVPDFTPSAAERIRLFDSGSVNRKTRLPPPSSEPFFKVPSTMPVRHSRLRDEVSSAAPETPQRSSGALGLFGFATPMRGGQDSDSDDESVVETLLTPNAARMRQAQPPSAVKRSLSYISSWLKPDMYKSKSDERKGSQLPGLPVPPGDLLSRPRGPVETPAPKHAAKAVPPKELVSLDHVPLPAPSKLPRTSKPRRLVDLQHVPTPQPKEEMRRYISRRSSTSSVRDLVKEFEEKDKAKVHVLPPRVAELRRQASVGSLKSKGKPVWRP